jgi:glycosyltransferase involved in cell wall biosynthesis
MNEAEWRSTYGISGGTALPLVSILAINWNYEPYLESALASAVAQDYPHIEFIVADNNSDDGSAALIEAFVKRHPAVRFIRLPANLGQLGAAHHVFSEHRVHGELIAFLDTDDVLFPHFASHHVRAHLALGGSLGVSSSEAIQIGADGAVLTAGIPHDRLTRREPWPRIALASEAAHDAVTAIPIPSDATGWLWSPGTSNMIRRKSVDGLIAATPPDIPPTYCIDTVALPFAHVDGGSLLLEEPLSAYRTHGNNISSSMPRLQHFNPHRPVAMARTQAQGAWFRSGKRSITGPPKDQI